MHAWVKVQNFQNAELLKFTSLKNLQYTDKIFTFSSLNGRWSLNRYFRNNPEIFHPCVLSHFLFVFGASLISDIFVSSIY